MTRPLGKRASSPLGTRASPPSTHHMSRSFEGVMSRQSYEGVALAAPVTVPYRRYSTRAAHWWIARALSQLLKDSGLNKDEIDGLGISSFTLGPDTAVGLTQHLGMSLRWLDHVPMGGASGVVCLRRAARAVQAGDAEIVACIAGDTNHVDTFRRTLSTFSRFAQDAVYPYGSGGPNASFAFITDWWMRQYGVKREDFGKLCVAQRRNAMDNPYALLRKPLDLDAYLNARRIAEPLHLFDCVMPCAGADAYLVMTADRAKALGLDSVRLLGAIERHNAFPDDPVQMRGGWALDRDELWEQAGLGSSGMDFFQAYDDYPVITLMQIEDLGFCPSGEGAAFIREHEFAFDGDCPLNTWRRPALNGPGRGGGRFPRAGGSLAPAVAPAARAAGE